MFDKIFGGWGGWQKSWLDFGGDLDHDADTRILNEFLPTQDRAIK